MTLDEYFNGFDDSRRIFDALHGAVFELGAVELRVTKSQAAFYRRRAFAWAWMPGKELGRKNLAPLVLTVALHQRDASLRWKEIVEPAPGRFTHHLELRSAAEIDDQVRAWLEQAWHEAG
jgi:hypothetical protein